MRGRRARLCSGVCTPLSLPDSGSDSPYSSRLEDCGSCFALVCLTSDAALGVWCCAVCSVLTRFAHPPDCFIVPEGPLLISGCRGLLALLRLANWPPHWASLHGCMLGTGSSAQLRLSTHSAEEFSPGHIVSSYLSAAWALESSWREVGCDAMQSLTASSCHSCCATPAHACQLRRGHHSGSLAA